MIEFKNVNKTIKGKKIINNISMSIETGQFVVLIGPSGCGKTTTLKMINRLIYPTGGDIFINGENILNLSPIRLRRNIGYVIQQTGLFPHMTVAENIGIVPSLKKWPSKNINEKTIELLTLMGMKPQEYLNRYPNELSGGQRQRIGVARALAANPEIILMDEPFSALDPLTRNQLQDEFYNIQLKLKKTIVFVTHDMNEALKLGDKICIMKEGNILQYDTPENILKNPSHGFVEEFIGRNRIWDKPELIKAKDIMINEPVKTSGVRSIFQGMEIMKSNNVNSILIVGADSEYKGIVTLYDIRKASNRTMTLNEIMDNNYITVQENDSIIDVLKKMKENNNSYIPVINDNNKLKGLITKSSLLDVLSSKYIGEEALI